ncbi:MAG TPA: hypothetical protein VFX66_03395 [Sulfuricurvum sp.]|nr:hypothetical protein [Sulfuricurvum sp.]
MKPIKVYLCLLFVLCAAVVTPECTAKELPASKITDLIRPIESLAIQYGTGTIKAYIFVDPKCPYSRDFLSMIHDNDKMRSIYRYYIFFYELKRLHSHALIGTIYASSAPLQQTLEVMVGEKEIEEQKSFPAKVDERIGSIEAVAEAIGVNKRPYLIIKKELD